LSCTAISITAPASAAKLTGKELVLGKTVVLVQAGKPDAGTDALVRQTLTRAGVEHIRTANRLPASLDATYVVLGAGDTPVLASAQARVQATAPAQDEGYVLATAAVDNGALIVLAGKDSDGVFYAAQTLRQIAHEGTLPAIIVNDHPAMPVRGIIEGFYGKPWSMAERADHITFLAGMKANTYIYSPKDEIFARDK